MPRPEPGPPPEAATTYWKVPFERDGRPSRAAGAERPGVSFVPADGDARLVAVVAEVLAHSPDAADRAKVATLGAEGAARHLVASVADYDVRREPGWWELLLVGGEPAGFVLPARYLDCGRDGLDEATIFHVGVRPNHRGHGLGRLLLRRATDTLVDHGVWRISCDTAANNDAMISLFESEGWTRLAPVERPI